MTIKRIVNENPGRLLVQAEINSKRLQATVDSGAVLSYISPRWVEKNGIPYRRKARPYPVRLADDNRPEWGDGWIHLETQEIEITVSGIQQKRSFDIMDLGSEDMLLGWDWLNHHNPMIDWR